MIRNAVLNAQAAEPAVCQVDLDLAAQHPLRADRKYVADDKHPDHELRIDRGPAHLGIIGRELPMYPRQNVPTTDQGPQQSRERGDRPEQPHQDGMNKTAVLDYGSAAPSSSAPTADGLRATESPFATILNGLLQQNLP